MSKHNKVPPMFEMAGAVPLGGNPPPRTMHDFIFQGVNVDWGRVYEEDGKTLRGFQLIIHDPADNTTYRLPFNEANRRDMLAVLTELGEKNDIR